MPWTEYERNAWGQIQDRKQRWYEELAEDTWARRTGEAISGRAKQAIGQAKRIPGAERAAAALGQGAGRFQQMVTGASGRTVRTSAVLRMYSRRGIEATTIAQLRTFTLDELDPVVHSRRLDLRYGGIAAAGGAAAGAVVTAGEGLAVVGGVAGQGAGAAPGFGVVAGAMTADAALVLALCGRSVGHTATLYGFDPNDPAEKLFALSVINVGSAMTQGAKYTALADLSKLTQALARSAPWTKLNEFVLAKVATKFAEQFSVRLTKQSWVRSCLSSASRWGPRSTITR